MMYYRVNPVSAKKLPDGYISLFLKMKRFQISHPILKQQPNYKQGQDLTIQLSKFQKHL